MTHFNTHLTVLEEASSKYRSYPVFKVPRLVASEPEQVEEWYSISYGQFKSDVELYAKYWSKTLAADGLPPRTVIGLWLGGMTYIDVLHIYGIARAGYVPQLFSLRLPNPDVIYELMSKAGAKALIHDRSFQASVTNCPLPIHVATPLSDADVTGSSLPPLYVPQDGDEVAMVFHTSGSTSGSPKLVPCNYTWLNAAVAKTWHLTKPKNKAHQDVTVWMGSMCHIGQTYQLFGYLQHGTCTIQPTKIAFSSEELLDMIARCRLNRLNQFATFLANHIRNARHDPKIMSALNDLDELLYAGLAMPHDVEQYALENHLPLRSLFGSTECGAMLLSVGGKGDDSQYLRPLETTSYSFVPISESSEEEYSDANSQLKELVILSESGDCPANSLRSADGHYHTGDLFIEVRPGCYISRGRDDDWIKSENSLRCDTKAIEDNVRSTCSDLISECIVVGNGRPSPALFVEPKEDGDIERLKRTILRRIRHFHSRRYLHERITSATLIFVVPKGTLPRTATKGNIRRKAVEETFKSQLDAVYGSSF